jgi:hypothetical protein
MTEKVKPKIKDEELECRYAELEKKVYKLSDLSVGTIQPKLLTCGKPGCKCAKGEKHGPYQYLAYHKEDGSMEWIYIPKKELAQIKSRIENFENLEREIKELVKIEFKLKGVKKQK